MTGHAGGEGFEDDAGGGLVAGGGDQQQIELRKAGRDVVDPAGELDGQSGGGGAHLGGIAFGARVVEEGRSVDRRSGSREASGG